MSLIVFVHRTVGRVAFGAVLALPTSAFAGEPADGARKEACATASEDAQKLRDMGKLLSARASLTTCASESCPPVVRKACTEWLADVETSIPTIVVLARDDQERDIVDVRLFVDGTPVQGRLDGLPRPIDPGVHTLRFETKDSPAIVLDNVVIAAGEKNRTIRVDFRANAKGEKEAPITPPARGVPTASFVLAGVSAVAFGVGAYGFFDAKSYIAGLPCKPNCGSAERDSFDARVRVATIGAIVGGLALAGAVAVYFLTPRDVPKRGGVGLAIGAGPSEAALQLHGQF